MKPKTKLPWRLSPQEIPPCIESVPDDDGEFGDTVTGMCNGAGDYDPCPEDAAYIVHACNAVPGLEAALARKDALLKEALGPVKYAARVMPRAFYAMMEPEEVEQAKARGKELDALAARIEAELGGKP